MFTLITLIHIVVCFILIIVVLLQSGKSADLAGTFGGGGSQSIFGPRGTTNILSKVTTICAVLFMFTSIGLWILSAKGAKSVVKGEEPPAVTETESKQPAAVTESEKKKGEEQKAPDQQKKQKEEKKSKEQEEK